LFILGLQACFFGGHFFLPPEFEAPPHPQLIFPNAFLEAFGKCFAWVGRNWCFFLFSSAVGFTLCRGVSCCFDCKKLSLLCFVYSWFTGLFLWWPFFPPPEFEAPPHPPTFLETFFETCFVMWWHLTLKRRLVFLT
jgi:hypothetical protein